MGSFLIPLFSSGSTGLKEEMKLTERTLLCFSFHTVCHVSSDTGQSRRTAADTLPVCFGRGAEGKERRCD